MPRFAPVREHRRSARSRRRSPFRRARKRCAPPAAPVIDLGAGEPDFPTPAFVMDAAQRALDAGATRYTQVEGILPLRESDRRARERQLRGATDRPRRRRRHARERSRRCSTRASRCSAPATKCSCRRRVGPSYYEMLALARATPIAVRGSRARQLKVTPDDLRAPRRPRTRGVILNSPCNPTGAVYSRDELATIVALAARARLVDPERRDLSRDRV